MVWTAWAVAALAATTPATTKTTTAAKAPAATSKTAPKAGAKKTAASPPKASGAVATVGTSRTIDQIDIQRAAQALYTDPLRVKDPAKWRRSLLDRCVDRELLDMEAQRQGLDRDSALIALRNEREYSVFWREIYRRVLIPRLTPTEDELKAAYATSKYRRVDLSVILIRTDLNPGQKPLAQRIATAGRGGARFDSLAKLYSEHPPTKAKGGRIGWVLMKDVNPAWFEDAKKASEGAVLGPYVGPVGDEIYKIAAFQELTHDSLSHLIYFERSRSITDDYQREMLSKYHFAVDSTQMKGLIFAVASESPDSILKSLRPDGTRDKQGARPALGVLARCDGRTITFPDLLESTSADRREIGGIHLDSEDEVRALCARAVMEDLTSRDGRDRGIDRDPAIARELRLIGEEVRTHEMVRRNTPSFDEASVRTYFDANPDRFKRPRTRRVKIVTFASPESAAVNAQAWRASGSIDDKVLAARNDFHETKLVTPWTASAGQYAVARYGTMDLPEGSDDPLTRAVQGKAAGAVVGPIALPYGGHAVMQVLQVEDARPRTFDEARTLAHRLKREEDESRWVDAELTRLRASTPVHILPGRLEATKLASHGNTTSTGGVAE
ncbi:MAG TPA: peptidyl-prolyl cis-trans isomerase [Candidatus Eisenbacteria bacterium]|nr:peptidyl-prolyl cis-trans isomerase [Candidatus Eisenbacteria bacterium]